MQIAADPSWRPDTSFETRQVESSLLRGLAALTPSQRQALALTYYRGMTHKEVALAMGAPLGTAKAWVRRGLDVLRTHVERAEGSPSTRR